MASDVGQALVFQKETNIYFYPAMFDITPESQSCTVTTQQPLTFNNNSNCSNLQQLQVLTTEIALERGVTRESTVFDCLDPDPWCFPNPGEHHRPNPTTPSSIQSSIHQSTSESTLRNPTSVLSFFLCWQIFLFGSWWTWFNLVAPDRWLYCKRPRWWRWCSVLSNGVAALI